jgi:hypothetical protein
MPQKLGDEVVGMREKFLLYGAPGTGKTFAAGTAPRPYFLIAGPPNEVKTLRAPQFLDRYSNQEIYYDFIIEETGKRGVFEEAKAFDRACDLLDDALTRDADEDDDFSFETLVVDNATVLLSYQMHKAMEFNSTRQKSGKTTLKNLQMDNILIPADNDYMSQMSLMNQFVDWLFKIDKHVVLIAHEYMETSFDRKTRQTSIHAIKPLFTGKQRTEIPRAFDNVWRFEVSGSGRSTLYEAQTAGSNEPTILAKTRFGGVLRQKERDVNLTEIIQQFQSVGSKE